MKKIVFILTPLASISYLVNCSGQIQPKQYVVTFDSNGGTPINSQTVQENKCAVKPENPTHAGDERYAYIFNEWQLAGQKFDFATPITQNITLKADWNTVNKYTLTVTSGDTSKGTVTGSGSYPCGSNVTIKATPCDGYAFIGWYENDVLVSQSTSYTFTMPTKNVSYVAKFINANTWYLKPDWWNYCSNGIDGEQATISDIGREVNLTVNKQVHKIRLIGIDHDDLYSENGKAHCTFEFANLLSDENGYSLTTFKDNRGKDAAKNFNHLNSNLRRALDNTGQGVFTWYKKQSPTKANIYHSAFSMLPSDLITKIKSVSKFVVTTADGQVTKYQAWAFSLTYKEMTKTIIPGVASEGTTYQYYENNDNPSARIKHQVKWHDGAVTTPTTITDLDYSNNASNYAGYNDSKDTNGGIYWLVSPYTIYTHKTWIVNGDGSFGSDNESIIFNNTHAIAPAFCI